MRITLVGKSGKMGQILCGLIDEDSDLEIVEEDCDLVIDFSSEEGTKAALAKKKPLVCGTTGLSEETFAQMEELAKEVPVLYSPNFSLGIALCSLMLEQVGEKWRDCVSIEIEETHHTQKKDSPSGTALKLAKLLNLDPKKIIANRIDDVVGIHQINCLFDAETVTLRHEALSREAFARGAIRAAKFLLTQPARIYGIRDLFY